MNLVQISVYVCEFVYGWGEWPTHREMKLGEICRGMNGLMDRRNIW